MEENQKTNSPSLNTPFAIIIAGVLIAGGIYFGLTNDGNQNLGLNNTNSEINTVTISPITTPTGQTQGTSQVKVSIEDDAVLGKADAPVTLIEFSDYECPYCKQAYTQNYTNLKKDYIDTGKVKFVSRDLPLSFHDPMATKEAIAANCAKEQKGDNGYFDFHDELYNRTQSGGNGLTVDDLKKIAVDLKLNSNQFKSCLDTEKYKDEVQKDISDASTAGATGTPTYFIGKSTQSGEIEAEMIVGAVPYASLKAVIDKYLTKN